jgi:hypothetical protein
MNKGIISNEGLYKRDGYIDISFNTDYMIRTED